MGWVLWLSGLNPLVAGMALGGHSAGISVGWKAGRGGSLGLGVTSLQRPGRAGSAGDSNGVVAP